MEYGINIGYFTKGISLEKAAELVARAGFTQLDYTPPLLEDNWEAEMKKAAKIFAENGLSVHQTHAPFNRYGRYGDKHILCMDRCAEATEFFGAKYIAVHGDEFDFDHLTFTPEAALAYNHDYFLPYVERSVKNGYKLAFETVFEDHPTRRRYTSQADELLALINSFDGDAACCWDFGHGHVTFRQKAVEHIRTFGSLIQCTHLHDNTGIDAHALPTLGDIDWNATMAAFKEIGYNGVLSVEYSHGVQPEHLVGPFLDLTYKTAEYLWSL